MKKFKNKIFLISVLLISFSCDLNKKNKNEINIYSQRHYAVDELQYKNFTEETGIKVNVTKANADELIQRLNLEGESSPADLFITVDVGKLWQAGEMGLFQKINDQTLTRGIDKKFLDQNDFWVPLTYRSRIIVYSNERVNKNELSTYEDLANEKWKNRLLIRSSSNSYNQALMSSLIANLGSDVAEDWARKIVDNLARDPKGNDRDQIRAIVANIGDIAIVNSYYIGLLQSSSDSLDRNVGQSVEVFFPNQEQEERGAHINISGIGLLKNSPNKDNAIKFIKFLTSEYAQTYYTNNSYEYPVNKNVKPSSIIAKWGDFKIDSLNLNELGIQRKQAVEIFEKSQWN